MPTELAMQIATSGAGMRVALAETSPALSVRAPYPKSAIRALGPSVPNTTWMLFSWTGRSGGGADTGGYKGVEEDDSTFTM